MIIKKYVLNILLEGEFCQLAFLSMSRCKMHFNTQTIKVPNSEDSLTASKHSVHTAISTIIMIPHITSFILTDRHDHTM